MPDPYRALSLLHGLSLAGMQDQRPSQALPGMLGQMPPEQLEKWRELMRQQQMQQRQMELGARPGIGFAGAGHQGMAPLAAIAQQNPLLLQMLMGMR